MPRFSYGRSESDEVAPVSPIAFSSEHFVPESVEYPEPNGQDFEVANEEEDESEAEFENDDGEEEEEFDVSILDGSRDAPEFSFPFTVFAVWIFILLSAISISWWRSERLRVGYCEIEGQGRYVKSTGYQGVFTKFELDCLPCPPHAKCFSGFRLECDPDYLFVRSPLALGGFLPISAQCVADTEKLQRAKVLAAEELSILRRRFAEVQCSGVAKGENDPTMTAEELKAKLFSLKSVSWQYNCFLT